VRANLSWESVWGGVDKVQPNESFAPTNSRESRNLKPTYKHTQRKSLFQGTKRPTWAQKRTSWEGRVAKAINTDGKRSACWANYQVSAYFTADYHAQKLYVDYTWIWFIGIPGPFWSKDFAVNSFLFHAKMHSVHLSWKRRAWVFLLKSTGHLHRIRVARRGPCREELTLFSSRDLWACQSSLSCSCPWAKTEGQQTVLLGNGSSIQLSPGSLDLSTEIYR